VSFAPIRHYRRQLTRTRTVAYRIAQHELDAAHLGADLAYLDQLDNAALAHVVDRRFDAAVQRATDPHDDPSYLRAALVQTARDAFHEGRLVPLRIRPFAI
jgi:hypothetical protein